MSEYRLVCISDSRNYLQGFSKYVTNQNLIFRTADLLKLSNTNISERDRNFAQILRRGKTGPGGGLDIFTDKDQRSIFWVLIISKICIQ